jgi:hypothetical protein
MASASSVKTAVTNRRPPYMALSQTIQADRVARSLKRLGFRMTRAGRSFTIIDSAGELAAGSKSGMSLAEIERWIGEHIKPRRR